MRKVREYKGFVIAETNEKERKTGKNDYELFTKEEWAYGEGIRYAEHDAGTIKEAQDFIDCY